MSVDLRTLSLCSGGGGLEIGVELAVPSARTVCWVEWEAFCCAILVSRMEAGVLAKAPLWSDLRTFDGRPWRGAVDLVTAGYPCQPFSQAGSRRGTDDPRHLWPHVHRVIEEVRPSLVFLENVSGHVGLGFGTVLRDLHESGYRTTATLVTASEVGASHKRERVFILGYTGSSQQPRRKPEQPERERSTGTSQGVGDTEPMRTGSRDGQEPQAGIGRNRPTEPDNDVANARDGMLDQRSRDTGTQHEIGTSERAGLGIGLPLFPPGPGELKRWAEILAVYPELAPAVEPPLRGVVDGLAATRRGWLRALGNGVCSLQAAYAFSLLTARLWAGELRDAA